LSGEWTEADSHKKVHEELQKRVALINQYKDPIKMVRDLQEKE
jgi:hypothetical protein